MAQLDKFMALDVQSQAAKVGKRDLYQVAAASSPRMFNCCVYAIQDVAAWKLGYHAKPRKNRHMRRGSIAPKYN